MNFIVTLPSWAALVAAYGLTFGLQNKALFLRRFPGMSAMLRCTYCTGFHAGWAVWAVTHAPFHWGQGPAARVALQMAFEWGVWGFAGAAFSYASDALVQAAEAARTAPRGR